MLIRIWANCAHAAGQPGLTWRSSPRGPSTKGTFKALTACSWVAWLMDMRAQWKHHLNAVALGPQDSLLVTTRWCLQGFSTAAARGMHPPHKEQGGIPPPVRASSRKPPASD